MPIHPQIRKFYPDDWDEIRETVLERATERRKTDAGHPILYASRANCEWCGAPNDRRLWRGLDGWALQQFGRWFGPQGEQISHVRIRLFRADSSRMEHPVVLTVAHLDQDPRGDDPDRLRALCQRCHLTYDQQPMQRATRHRIYAELLGQQTLTMHEIDEHPPPQPPTHVESASARRRERDIYDEIAERFGDE